MLPGVSLPCHIIWSLLGFLVVWAHRSNIVKLMHGKESKLSFTKRVDKMDDAQ